MTHTHTLVSAAPFSKRCMKEYTCAVFIRQKTHVQLLIINQTSTYLCPKYEIKIKEKVKRN